MPQFEKKYSVVQNVNDQQGNSYNDNGEWSVKQKLPSSMEYINVGITW
jgi:hypothetical protein